MRKTPKLRFKEFSGDWESKKLGDLGQSIIGLTYSPDDVVANGTLVLRSSNVKDNKIVYTDNVFVNMNIQEKIMTKENDILICSRNGSRGLIGKSALIDKSSENNAFGAFMTIFRSEQGKFIFQVIRTQKFFKQIHQNLGATINQITSKDLNSMQFYVPSREEQEKIASFFSLIDDKISLQGEKVKMLKDYKCGMMQKIFSRELRFKDDCGMDYPEWEENKLGDICTFFSGGTPLTSKSSYYNGDIPFIRSAEISGEKTELTISEEGLKNSSAKMVQKGDLLYALYGATSGEVSISKIDGAINQAILCIKSDNVDLSFIEQILIRNKENIINTYLQGGQGNLSANIIKGLKYFIPHLEEQEKISSFLDKLDTKIINEQKKLESLNEYKQGLLQQMFI